MPRREGAPVAFDTVPDVTISERPQTTSQNKQAVLPEKIGPSSVKKILGEGGMGVVYLAEQHEPVKRQLAVKVIRADMSALEAAARFAAERQALARLSHPHIAQLYEAGTTDEGHPYFAMEYFPGGGRCSEADRNHETAALSCGGPRLDCRYGDRQRPRREILVSRRICCRFATSP